MWGVFIITAAGAGVISLMGWASVKADRKMRRINKLNKQGIRPQQVKERNVSGLDSAAFGTNNVAAHSGEGEKLAATGGIAR